MIPCLILSARNILTQKFIFFKYFCNFFACGQRFYILAHDALEDDDSYRIHNNGDYDGGEQRDIRAVADALEHIVAEQTVSRPRRETAHGGGDKRFYQIGHYINADFSDFYNGDDIENDIYNIVILNYLKHLFHLMIQE